MRAGSRVGGKAVLPGETAFWAVLMTESRCLLSLLAGC